jgi:hypothetical protein
MSGLCRNNARLLRARAKSCDTYRVKSLPAFNNSVEIGKNRSLSGSKFLAEMQDATKDGAFQ